MVQLNRKRVCSGCKSKVPEGHSECPSCHKTIDQLAQEFIEKVLAPAVKESEEKEGKEKMPRGKKNSGVAVLENPQVDDEEVIEEKPKRNLIIVMDASDATDFRVKEAAANGCSCGQFGLGYDEEMDEIVCPACDKVIGKPTVDAGGFEKPAVKAEKKGKNMTTATLDKNETKVRKPRTVVDELHHECALCGNPIPRGYWPESYFSNGFRGICPKCWDDRKIRLYGENLSFRKMTAEQRKDLLSRTKAAKENPDYDWENEEPYVPGQTVVVISAPPEAQELEEEEEEDLFEEAES